MVVGERHEHLAPAGEPGRLAMAEPLGHLREGEAEGAQSLQRVAVDSAHDGVGGADGSVTEPTMPTHTRSVRVSTASLRSVLVPAIHHAAVVCTMPTIARPQTSAGAGSRPRAGEALAERLGDPLGDAARRTRPSPGWPAWRRCRR